MNPLPESLSAAGALSSLRNCEIQPSRCSITARSEVDKVVNRSRHGCQPCNSHKLPPNSCFTICSDSYGRGIIVDLGVYGLSVKSYCGDMTICVFNSLLNSAQIY